jgi:hypothetical protein
MQSLKYNKDRSFKSGASPRDLQQRNLQRTISSDPSIKDLIDQITILTTDLNTIKQSGANASSALPVSAGKAYTEDEFNTELTAALVKELAQYDATKSKVTEDKDREIAVLSSKVQSLEDLIKSKDDLISTLKNTSTSINEVIKVPGRPSMEESVIDPTEIKSNVESFINIKEDKTSTSKEVMQNKVDKLKSILG